MNSMKDVFTFGVLRSLYRYQSRHCVLNRKGLSPRILLEGEITLTPGRRPISVLQEDHSETLEISEVGLRPIVKILMI